MDKQLAQLEDVLVKQAAAAERLEAILKQKLDAVRRAQHDRMTDYSRLENEQVQVIGDLEKQRLVLVAELTQLVDPDASQPLRLGELAERLPEPMRGRLLVLRQQLRQRLQATQHETSVARLAAETLLHHIQGIVQTISGALSGVGTYGKQGAPPRVAMAVSTFSATA